MSALIRYLTSFFATICHILSGLSVIAATLWFVPAITFFLPGVVIGLGDAIGISLTQFVSDIQSSPLFTTVTLLASFVGFVVNFVLLKVLGDRLYAIGRPTPAQRAAASQQAATAGERSAATQQAASETKDYCREFRNMSYVMSGFMGLLFVAFLVFFDPAAIPETVLGGGDSISMLFAGFAVIYGVVGYGAQRGSLEAVIVGTLVFVINFISGLLSVNTLGILVGGFGTYYGIRALLSGDLDLIVVEELRTRHGSQHQSNYGTGTAGQGGNAGQAGAAGQTGAQPQGGNAHVEQPTHQQASDPMETQKVAPAERQQQPETAGKQGGAPSQQGDDESGNESQQAAGAASESSRSDDQRPDE